MDAILQGLGTPYRPFVRSLEACLQAISFDDLFGLLFSEEVQLKAENLTIFDTPTALYTIRTPSFSCGRGRRGSLVQTKAVDVSLIPNEVVVEPPPLIFLLMHMLLVIIAGVLAT